jgi:hypothetical protein
MITNPSVTLANPFSVLWKKLGDIPITRLFVTNKNNIVTGKVLKEPSKNLMLVTMTILRYK